MLLEASSGRRGDADPKMLLPSLDGELKGEPAVGKLKECTKWSSLKCTRDEFSSVTGIREIDRVPVPSSSFFVSF